MILPGDSLENPVTGERFTFIHTAASTGGELLAFDFALRPGGKVPIPHVHPIQTERFEVISGCVRFRIGRQTYVAGAGEVVEAPPGVAHGFGNAGRGEARMRVEVRPALAMEDMFAEVVALAEDHKLTRRGLPRNLLTLASLARRYDQEAHAPLLTVGVQRLLLAPLVWLGSRVACRRQRLEHRSADVLVDHGRVHVGDLRALGQAVDHERVQRVGIRDRDVQQEVRRPRDDEDADDLRQLADPVAERLDDLAPRRAEGDRGQRLHVPA
jgi:quercetin dioxygenase-like cupin family protein